MSAPGSFCVDFVLHVCCFVTSVYVWCRYARRTGFFVALFVRRPCFWCRRELVSVCVCVCVCGALLWRCQHLHHCSYINAVIGVSLVFPKPFNGSSIRTRGDNGSPSEPWVGWINKCPLTGDLVSQISRTISMTFDIRHITHTRLLLWSVWWHSRELIVHWWGLYGLLPT